MFHLRHGWCATAGVIAALTLGSMPASADKLQNSEKKIGNTNRSVSTSRQPSSWSSHLKRIVVSNGKLRDAILSGKTDPRHLAEHHRNVASDLISLGDHVKQYGASALSQAIYDLATDHVQARIAQTHNWETASENTKRAHDLTAEFLKEHVDAPPDVHQSSR